MMVPPMPSRCSAGIPASVSVRLAISPSTYDSVNFFEPITMGFADADTTTATGIKNNSKRILGRARRALATASELWSRPTIELM